MEDLRQELPEVTPEPAGPPPKAKKKRTPAKPTRLPEDLAEIAPKKMTDKEKDNYIIYLREELDHTKTMIEHLKEACDSAYERVRETEDRIRKITDRANLKLNLIKDNVKVMANNVMTILEK